MGEECIFCRMVKGEVSCTKIYENDNFFSIFDNNPVSKGHSLVICKKHFENTLDAPSSLGPELLDCIKKTTLKVLEDTKAEGFNIVNNNFESAGQKVKHLHFHIIPRKKDDGLKIIA